MWWVLEGAGPAGSLSFSFSALQMNGWATGVKEKHCVSTLTPSDGAPRKVGSWICCVGLQQSGIMFLTNVQTSSGIYGLAGLRGHLGSGSTLIGYYCAGVEMRVGLNGCVCTLAHVMHMHAYLCVNTHSVFMPVLKCKRSDLHVIWPANRNLIFASCTHSSPSPSSFSSWGKNY